MANLDPVLMEILVCPISHAPLKVVGDTLVSTDAEQRYRYRIEDGIPVMLVEEAEELSVDDWQTAMNADGPVTGS